jgi:hypothetical protein
LQQDILRTKIPKNFRILESWNMDSDYEEPDTDASSDNYDEEEEEQAPKRRTKTKARTPKRSTKQRVAKKPSRRQKAYVFTDDDIELVLDGVRKYGVSAYNSIKQEFFRTLPW